MMSRLIPLFLVTVVCFPSILAGAAESVGVAPSQEEITPLKVGQTIPEVTVVNPKGKDRNLAKLTEAKLSIIVFYRGGWCPYCNTHLAELGKSEAELKALGFQILALSPDGVEYAAKTAGDEKIGYKIFSDNTFAAAKAFGVAFKMDSDTQTQYQGYFKDRKDHDFGILPVPAVFIVDKEGVIKFVYTNADYKVRLTKDDLLKAARDAAGSQ